MAFVVRRIRLFCVLQLYPANMMVLLHEVHFQTQGTGHKYVKEKVEKHALQFPDRHLIIQGTSWLSVYLCSYDLTVNISCSIQ